MLPVLALSMTTASRDTVVRTRLEFTVASNEGCGGAMLSVSSHVYGCKRSARWRAKGKGYIVTAIRSARLYSLVRVQGSLKAVNYSQRSVDRTAFDAASLPRTLAIREEASE